MHRTRPRLRTALAAFASTLLLTGGITAAAPAAQAAPSAEDFQQVTLAKGVEETGEPMTLAVLPDSSVLHTSRDGVVRLTDSGGTTKVAGEIDVYDHDEEGMQGVGVDPDFETNRAVYLYYAPPMDTPDGDAPEAGEPADFEPFDGVNRLSRFTLGEDGTLDTDSEQKVLEVPASRGICCHVGGDIAFDADGNLLLSTGDDSNPFQSDGYAPIDERENRNPAFDAQRSSANTNDLRGKILRIKVGEDGSYDIPEGNLFEEGTEKTRPEIYAMGFRNPFRMTVDKPTGTIYLGEYGPDAGSANDDRGPAGQVEFNRITEPGNYGWPYCHGDNDAYVDYDFGDKSSGESFDCSAPVNESPNNTGLTELPEAKPGWINYDGGSIPEFGSGSESPMGGPVYRYDADLDSDIKFPEEFDGDFFAGEFGRKWIKRIEQGEDGTVESINDFPWDGTQVMDMEFGPDGALYVLDYGTGFFNGDHNSAVYRIENVVDGYSPVAEASADVTSGQAPLKVAFSSEGTSDADGDKLTYSWDFGDGKTSKKANPKHTYTGNGTFTATVTTKDPAGNTGTASVHITVGNTAPTVELKLPENGQVFEFGDKVPFEVEVTDPEDGDIDCEKVKVSYILGHDSHGHPITSANGCEGTLTTAKDGDHGGDENVFGIIDAEYTDGGGKANTPPLTSHDQHHLQPAHRQAEHYTDSKGVEKIDKDEAHGGQTVGEIHDGDWIAFKPYALGDAPQLTARVSSGFGGLGGTLEVRAGAPDGDLLGSAKVSGTGSWETFEDVTVDLKGAPEGSTTLYLVFTGWPLLPLFDVDDFTLKTGTQPDDPEVDEQVLVFSKTAGFRHGGAISEGIDAIEKLGAEHRFGVDATEDAGEFTKDNLAKYDAVIWLNTTGNVLNDAQQSAFEQYIESGGGYVGVHAAADTEYDWPFYGELVGAYFDSHPHVQDATIKVEDRGHPATAHLGGTWERKDEWYNYATNPRDGVRVLASLDEDSYWGGNMDGDHPIAWCQEYEGGRSFYTGGGHTKETFAEEDFRTHLLGGIRYATGAAQADCSSGTGHTPLLDGTSADGWKQAGSSSFDPDKAEGTLTPTGGL